MPIHRGGVTMSYSVNEKNKEASMGPTVKIRKPMIHGVMKAYAQRASRRAKLQRERFMDDCIHFSSQQAMDWTSQVLRLAMSNHYRRLLMGCPIVIQNLLYFCVRIIQYFCGIFLFP